MFGCNRLALTKELRDIVHEAAVTEGIVIANTLHATCGLFVNVVVLGL
jgi:thiamine phosphate synthase YjbQ (UPF0047 family)